MNIYKLLRRELRTPRYWLKYKKSINVGPKIEVLDLFDSVRILRQGVSLSRFGDGEFRILMQNGEAIGFQKHSEALAQKLIQVLNIPKKNHTVALPGPLSRSLFEMNKDARSFWVGALSENGCHWKGALDFGIWNDKQALNTQITRPYMDYKKNLFYYEMAKEIFKQFKMIWKNKHILIVEGEKTNFGYENDLLSSAADVSKIIVPSKDAFSKYEQILELSRDVISTYDKQNLIVLLAIGPTATVLSYDLADNGFQVIDIGHLDVEYQWYLMHAKQKTSLENRTVNEVSDSQFIKTGTYDQFKILGRIK